MSGTSVTRGRQGTLGRLATRARAACARPDWMACELTPAVSPVGAADVAGRRQIFPSVPRARPTAGAGAPAAPSLCCRAARPPLHWQTLAPFPPPPRWAPRSTALASRPRAPGGGTFIAASLVSRCALPAHRVCTHHLQEVGQDAHKLVGVSIEEFLRPDEEEFGIGK